MRNALVLREGPHPPVFRQKGVPVMMGKSQGKSIHQTQGPTPALIGDRRRHAIGIQALHAKSHPDQISPVIASKVDELLVEQQVRYGEWKAQLEHPVEQIPLRKLDQHGAVADEDLHGELVRCPHHDALDFTDPQIQQFGGFGF